MLGDEVFYSKFMKLVLGIQEQNVEENKGGDRDENGDGDEGVENGNGDDGKNAYPPPTEFAKCCDFYFRGCDFAD